MIAQTKNTHSLTDFENTTEPQLSVVKFHNKQISCTVLPNGKIYVAIKPICDAIGIQSKNALLTIKKDSFLGAMVCTYTLLDSANRKFPMECLPLEFIHGWLFTINENLVNEKAKPKLKEFKKECYQVLFNHFFGKYQYYEDNLAAKRILWSKRKAIQDQVKELNSEAHRITKEIKEIDQAALRGQFQLAVKGGSHE